MKAVVLNEIGGVLELREVATPRPGKSQVLIKVESSGVNFAESQMRQGVYPVIPDTPVILGAEVAGVVEQVGEDADADLLGKRVVAVLFATGGNGGYAEYAVASVDEVIPIPDNVSYDDALAIPVQGLTAYFLLTEAAKISGTDTVLIHAAAGGVGSIAIQLAKILGIGKVFAGASSTFKLDLAKSLGADVLVNYSDPDWMQQMQTVTDGQGVSVILSSGTSDIVKQSFNLLAPYGRFVVYGSLDILSSSFGPDQVMQMVFNNQSLTGFYIGAYTAIPGNFKRAANYLLHLVSSGALKIVTSSRYELKDAQQAHEDMANRKTVGKVVLAVNGN
ncbi:zinc-binding alcohol dehydrogenase family protein [Mucilaginibacter sp.]|jgi:NADPH2:quinone reductase|uniref:quinone oxidoreductase family protein n=1 Tax=Mucilaginibacter sp. TaxID=1882438 RepID=UPI00356A4C58